MNPQYPDAPSDWGAIGVPEMFHANTDATLTVFKSGGLLGTGDQLFDIGTHTLIWEAETLISYPLDVALPALLMYLAPFKKLPEGKQFILDVLVEASIVGLNEFVIDSTPHEFFPIVNRQTQRIQVFDRDAPQITLSQDTVYVEALSPGGASGDRALSAIQPSVSTWDKCDRPVSVFADLPDFLPLGSYTVTWTALDAGPNPDSPRSDQRNETTVTQTIVIEDTMPPLLIPPADIVVESAGAAAIKFGQPLVFDVVDLEPAVTCEIDQSPVDCQATFNAPVGLTEITWTATDGSGQSAQGMQLVNVKIPGTNNTPVAHDQVLAEPVKSFDSIDIELTAEDMDGDRLAFALVDQPENGFFVAPLYPYFIEDYRIEAGSNPLTLEERCDEILPLPGAPNFELEYPYLSEWVSVTDEGLSYVYDYGHVDCQEYDIGGNPSLDRRIAVFDQEGELINAQFSGSDTGANDVWVDPGTGRVYMVYGTVDTTNGVTQLSANLDYEFFYNMDNAHGPGFSSDYIEEIESVVVGDDGLLYAATHFYISVFKIEGVTPQSNGTTIHPEYLGTLPNPNFSLMYDSIAMGPDGKLYASDRSKSRIYRYSASAFDADGAFIPGDFEGWLGKCTSDNNPGLETHCDVANQRSVGFACTDETCGVSGSIVGSEPGQFWAPKGIDIDPNGVLYVTDFQNNRVQRFTPEGYVAGIAQSDCSSNCFVLGDFGRPDDISVNSNRFYILDKQTQLLHVSETTPIKEVRDTSVVVEYSSDNNFVGTDTFTFEVTDGLRQDGVFVTSNMATVTVPVIRNDRLPIADAGITASTDEDVPVTITLDGNDPDFPLDTIDFQISTPPKFGTVSGSGANKIYTPNENYEGEDSFSFVLFDGTNTSEPEPVVVTMVPQNDPPVIDPDDMTMFGLGYAGTLMVPFTDPDAQDKHRVTVNWGDGSAVEQEGQPGPDGSLTGPLLQEGRGDSGMIVAEHLFTAVGNYPVEVCITDRVELDANDVKIDTAESTTACATTNIDVEQLPLVLVDIEPSNCSVDPNNEVEGPVCTATDGDDIDYTLSIRNVMPDVAGGLDATNVVLTAEVDSSLTITGVGETAARMLPGFSASTKLFDSNRESESTVQALTQCDWLNHVVTCTVDNVPSGAEVLIALNTSTDGTATMDRDVRLTTELMMDEGNLAAASKNAKEVFISLNPTGDADGDGVVNVDDAFPNDPNESVDTDGDGIGNVADIDDDADTMPDAWEARYGLNALVEDGAVDSDGDGLTNAEEYAAGADPTRADSDSDGLLDGADNCAARFNQNQYDSNFDGVGDVCDVRMTARALTAFDESDSFAGDYAILRSSRLGSRLWVGNATGLWRHQVQVLTPDLTALDMTRVNNADSSGALAIAVLAQDEFGSTRVSLVDPVDGELSRELFFFDPDWKASAVTVVPGAGSSGEDALAVLAKRSEGGLRIELRNASDGALTESIDLLGQGWRPIDIGALDDGTLAVLAEADSGQTKVVTSSASGMLSEIDFLVSNAIALADFTSDGDGALRFAVLAADASGEALVEIRDAQSGLLLAQETVLSAIPVDIIASSEGEAQLALLLADPISGEIKVSQRDGMGNEVQPEDLFLSNAYEPRAVIAGYGDALGVLGSDEQGVLSLALQSSINGNDQGLLTTSNNPNLTTMFFVNEWFDLETGEVTFCTGGCGSFDFRFGFNSSLENPVEFGKRSDLEVAFFDGTSFDDVNHTLAANSSYSIAPVNDPFDYDDTIVVRVANGDLYKIGHPQCFLQDISVQTDCAQVDGASEVTFAWLLLVPDEDQDGIDDDTDNCLAVPNPNQLDTDGDGYGNACDADLNNDCAVNFIDVSAMTSVFLCTESTPECQSADLDGSGSVNFIDYSMLTSAFLQTPGPSAQEDICSLPVVINQQVIMSNSISYNLDTGAAGGFGQPNMDIVFTRLTATSQIRPQQGASIAYWGPGRPSPDDCLATDMTLERVRFNENNVQIGDWFCARTNSGGISRFQLTAANVLPNPGQIEVDLTTWECDECETKYDPTPLPGIVGWFDADDADAFELEGSNVVDWKDRSGHIDFMGNAISSHRPTFTPNGINGRGSVTFDGIDDRLFSDSNISLASGYTVFIVARNDVRRNYNGLLSLRNTSTSGTHAAFEMYWQAGTTDSASGNIVVLSDRDDPNAGGYMQSNNAGPAIGNGYTVATRVSGDLSIRQVWADGQNLPVISGGSTNITPNNQFRKLCLGQGFGDNITNNILLGDIGEVLVFDRALTDAEFDFVSTYIGNKWGTH